MAKVTLLFVQSWPFIYDVIRERGRYIASTLFLATVR